MLFHSPEFVLLMLLTLALYAALPKVRIPLLALANLAFYGASGWEYLALFVAMAVLTHWCAVGSRGPHGRWFMWFGVITNLGNLVIFKYTGFFVANLERLAGLGLDPKVWQLILPVGISFYTFQLIAYLVDVYRGDLPPARNLVQFWVFISFFGQLIAGPIMRGKDFLPQIEKVEQQRLRADQFKYGIYLFVVGLIKKVALSDLLGPRTDIFFTDWMALNGLEAWIAGWLFAFQIYYDFSAYSDMALGIGHLFGFDLTQNFYTPYLSKNPGEFWKRWHVTLSTFIKDYIYIPLGGSRKGESRAYINLIVAMALSGFWHGAAWTFIIWGVFHGVLSALHKLWRRNVVDRFAWWPQGITARWVSIILMFQATTIGWIFFRGDSATAAITMVRRMLNPAQWQLTPLATTYLPVIGLLALLHLGEFWLRRSESAVYERWRRWVPTPVRALLYTALVALLLVITETEQVTFIYFRF